MKILILSDIHANFKALNSLDYEISHAETVLFLGDLIGYYKEVNEVVEYIKSKKNVISIRGNHDNYLWDTPNNLNEAVNKGIQYAKTYLTESNKQWIKELPYYRIIDCNGLSILMVHGSPWDYSNEYLYPDNPNILKLLNLDYDAIFFGHTHRPLLLTRNGKIAANPGSVGQSRHVKQYACALWWNTETQETDFISKSY